jgi:hypothetical protein
MGLQQGGVSGMNEDHDDMGIRNGYVKLRLL